jgi:hypothetical protein
MENVYLIIKWEKNLAAKITRLTQNATVVFVHRLMLYDYVIFQGVKTIRFCYCKNWKKDKIKAGIIILVKGKKL